MPEQPTPDAKRWMRTTEYARACGISHQAVLGRIQRETLTVTSLQLLDESHVDFIDTEKYPPQKLGPRGRAAKK